MKNLIIVAALIASTSALAESTDAVRVKLMESCAFQATNMDRTIITQRMSGRDKSNLLASIGRDNPLWHYAQHAIKAAYSLPAPTNATEWNSIEEMFVESGEAKCIACVTEIMPVDMVVTKQWTETLGDRFYGCLNRRYR